MATLIDEIFVRIEGETIPLERALTRTTGVVEKKTKRIKLSFDGMEKSIARGVKRSAVAVAGLAIAAAALTKRSLNLADAVDKGSKAAGLSAERFQTLTFASERAGITQEQLNVSLLSFRRRLGEARGGNTTYINALQELGVATQNAAGDQRAIEAVLDDVLVALDAVEDEARQTALASVLLGDDAGKKMPLLLQGGIKGLRALEQQARDVGLVMDQDLVDKAVKAKDELETVGQIIDTQLTIVLADNADALVRIALAVGAAIPAIVKGATELGKFLGLVESTDLERQAELIQKIRDDKKLLSGEGTFFPLNSQSRKLAEARLARNRAELDALGARIDARADQAAAGSASSPGGSGGSAGVSTGTASAGAPVPGDKQAALNAIMEEGAQLTAELRTVTEVHADEVARLDGLLRLGAITQKTYNKAMQAAKVDTVVLSETLKGGLVRALQAGQAQLSNIDVLGRGIFKSLGDSVKNVVNTMISEFLRLKAIQPLFNSIFGAIGLPGLSLGGRAGGGDVQPATPVLVGERGPEVFVPKTVGSIVPNSGIGRGGRPAIVNMTNRFDVGLESVDNRIAQAAAPIAAQAVRAIEEANARDFR